jgi:hypothetical protein
MINIAISLDSILKFYFEIAHLLYSVPILLKFLFLGLNKKVFL